MTDPIAEALAQFVPGFDPARGDWQTILDAAELPGRVTPADRHSRRRLARMRPRRTWPNRLTAVAVGVAALAGAGVAIAASFGAFNGVTAAQHPPTAADKLDPAVAASIAAEGNPLGLELDSARFVEQLADGIRIYAVATKGGQLCALAERLQNNDGKDDAAGMGCGSPLSQSQPTTADSFQANESTPTISWGIALDDVTAVSFMAGGKQVTVPVKNNVWAYEGQNPAFGSLRPTSRTAVARS